MFGKFAETHRQYKRARLRDIPFKIRDLSFDLGITHFVPLKIFIPALLMYKRQKTCGHFLPMIVTINVVNMCVVNPQSRPYRTGSTHYTSGVTSHICSFRRPFKIVDQLVFNFTNEIKIAIGFCS